MLRSLFARLWLITTMTLVASNASAQDAPRPEIPSPSPSAIPFDFSPPGARALGMGASFIAIADDATASEANPAGLTVLTRPEISVHGRHADYDVPFYDPNAEFFALFDPRYQDPVVPRFDETISNVSFASFVHPFQRAVVSVFYHEPGRFHGSSTLQAVHTQGADFFTSTRSLDVQVKSLGVSAALLLGPHISVGASVRDTHLKAQSSATIRADYLNDIEFETGNLNHIDFIQATEYLDDLDTALTYNIGLLINPNGRFSAGLVYKESGKYDIEGALIYEECLHAPDQGHYCNPGDFTGTPGDAVQIVEFDVRELELPDLWGLGLAWRPTDRLTLAADANWIQYSVLQSDEHSEAVEDSLQIHLGLEYTFLAGQGHTPVSLRIGTHTDPDHDGFAELDTGQTHLTLGFGIVARQQLQIDVGGRFSDSVREGILSLVYRF